MQGELWGCRVGTYLLPLLDLGEHHDGVALPLPHHPPEILHRVGKGALGGDEIILLPIALREETGITQGRGTRLMATGTSQLQWGLLPQRTRGSGLQLHQGMLDIGGSFPTESVVTAQGSGEIPVPGGI